MQTCLRGACIIQILPYRSELGSCGDDLIHQLNHDYREKDKATNVLSFCGLDEEEIGIEAYPEF